MAEAWRLHIGERGTVDVEAAQQVEHRLSEPIEARIVRCANGQPERNALREAMCEVHRVMAMLLLGGGFLTAIAGVAATRAALGGAESVVNFYLLLITLLGVQTVFLILWAAVVMFGPRRIPVGSIGSIVFSAFRSILIRRSARPELLAAAQSTALTVGRGGIGKWFVSGISHWLWLAFNVGCLLAVMILLSARHYTIGWETTILSAESYVDLTRAIAWLPDLVGFETPTAEQIAMSHLSDANAEPVVANRAWSSLLVGCIVLYGLGPRLLLLILSAIRSTMARRAYRIDLDYPAYQRLRSIVLPASRETGIVDPDAESIAPIRAAIARADGLTVASSGDVILVGYELERPAEWPPQIPDIKWNDLGMVDGRDDQRRALDTINASIVRCPVVVVCSLTTTPDRGAASFLARIGDAANGHLMVILTGGQSLRERSQPEDVEQRIADWRNLGNEAAIPIARIIDLDLDHATDESRARLTSALRMDGSTPPAPGRQIEEAFALVIDAAANWAGTPPGAQDQVALHRSIASLYGAERGTRPDWLNVDWRGPGDLTERLRDGALRVTTMLPDQLRVHSRWAVAGAIAGAMGCLAVTLAAPAAALALPAWTGVGAALGTAVRLVRGDDPTSSSDDPEHADDEPVTDISDAIRGATLFALLLELQGRDESAITRILTKVLDDDPPAVANAEDARRWLDGLRHAFDLALIQEVDHA